MQLRTLFAFALTLAAGSLAHAQDYQIKNLRIDAPYARATVPNQPSGAAYLTIENKGTEADKLIAAASPVANTTQIHLMSMEGNVMKMREVGQIELKPAEKLVMKPGDGYHLMLIGLHQPLKAGDKFPLTLTFEKAGKTEVSVLVQDRSGNHKGQASDHGMHRGH